MSKLDLSVIIRIIDEASRPLQRLRQQTADSDRAIDRLTQSIDHLNQTLNTNQPRQYAQSLTQVDQKTSGITNATRTLKKEYQEISHVLTTITGQAQRVVDSLAKSRANMRQEFKTLAIGTATAGYGAYQFLNPAITFEKQMSGVQSILGLQKSDSAMKMLKKEVRLQGAQSSFSPTEAAQAARALASGGFDAGKIKDSLGGTIQLAEAGEVELGRAAQIAVGTLNGFGLAAKDITRVNDVLLRATDKTATSVDGMGETMKYVAPIAKTYGASIEQTTAMVGLLGDNMILDTQAGTSLRSIMTRFAAPPKEALKTLTKLNIETKDSKGQLRDMAVILAEVQAKTKNMGSGDRLDVFKDLAGQEAVSAFAVLVDQSAVLDKNSGQTVNRIKELTKELEGAQGAAAHAAAILKDNLAGDIENLGGAFQDLSISVLEAIGGDLRGFIQDVTALVDRIKKWVDANPELVRTMANVAMKLLMLKFALLGVRYTGNLMFGTIFSLVAGITKLAIIMFIVRNVADRLGINLPSRLQLITRAVGMLSRAFIFLSRQAIPLLLAGLRAMAMAVLTNPLTWIVAAIVAVALVIYKYWGPIKAFFKGFWAGLQEGLAPLRESLSAVFTTIGQTLAPLKPIWDGLVAVFGLIGQAIGSLFSPFNATKEQLEGATSAGHSFGKWVGIIIGAPLQMLVNAFVLVGTAIGNAIGFIVTLPPKISAAWDGITAYFSGLWDGVEATFNSGIDAIKSIINSVDAVFADNPILNILLPFIGIPRMIIANWSSITAWFAALWTAVQQTFSRGVDLVKSVLLNWTVPGLIYKNWDAITTWFSTKWESIKSAFNTGIEATKSFLLNWTPAGYVYSHWDGISSWFSSKWEATKGAFSTGVEGSKSVLSTWVPAGVYSRWDGISSWFATKWEQIKAFFSSGIGNISKTILDWSPLNLFYQVFAKVLSWFGVDLPAKFSGFGKMIIDGLVGGIEKGFEKLKGAWEKVNSYMPDLMRKRMDIHSPSRVFAGIGDHIMQGLGKGISENESPIIGLKDKIKNMLAISAISLPMAITANAALPAQQQTITQQLMPVNIPAVIHQQQKITQALAPAAIPPVANQQQSIIQRLVAAVVPPVGDQKQTIFQRLASAIIPPVANQQQNLVQRLVAAVVPPAGDQQQTIFQRLASAIIPPVANQQQSIIQRLVAAVVPPAGDQQQTIFQRLASVAIPAPTDQQQTISQVLKPAILNLPEVFHSILKLTLDNSFTKNIPTMLMASMGYDTGIIKNPPPVPDVTPIMARMVSSQPVNAGNKTPPSMVIQGDTYNIHLYQQPGQSNEQLAQLVRKEIEKLKQQKQAAIRSSFLDKD